MRSGVHQIVLDLRIGDEDPEEVNRQVLAYVRRDYTPDQILDVITAFAALSAAGWPGSSKFFRLYVRVFLDLWTSELSALPVSERYDVSVQTLEALGMPLPEGAAHVAELARAELARRGFVVEGGKEVLRDG